MAPKQSRLVCAASLLMVAANAVRMTEDTSQGASQKVLSQWSSPLETVLDKNGKEKFPKLCSEETVKSGCDSLDLGRSDDKMASIDEISEVMSADIASTRKFLAAIKIQVASDASSESILCQELCEKTMAGIGAQWLPPRSDIGCRPDRKGGVICDLDLSESAQKDIVFRDDTADQHKGRTVRSSLLEASSRPAFANITSVSELLEPLGTQAAKMRVANLFRAYPLIDVKVDDDIEEEGEKVGAPLPSFFEADRLDLASKGCEFCQITSRCKSYEFACKNCQICKDQASVSPSPPPRPAHPSTPRPVHPSTPRPVHPFTPRPVQPSTPRPAHPSTPRPAHPSTPRPAHKPQKPIQKPVRPDNWLDETYKISAKAQAYTAKAIAKAPRDTAVLKRWFGEDSRLVRAQVMKVLNSLSGMLADVEYKVGDECEKNTYAYVYPYGRRSMNADGQFIFFLCDLYFKSDEGEQIETLTHEGSHHASAYTEDECMEDLDEEGECDDQAYGRSECKTLAEEHPGRAQQNADNYCYYINDINDHQQTKHF